MTEVEPIRNHIKYFLLGLVVVAGLAVSGCQPSSGNGTADKPTTRSAVLLKGRIQVQAPDGYCVDPASIKDHARAGFVLMAGCDGLAGLPSGTLVTPAIMTVSALVPRQGDAARDDIAQVLGADQIIERETQGGLTILHVRNEALVPEGSDPRHWRGTVAVNGAVLTMAVYGNGKIAEDTGRTLLLALAQRTLSASAKLAAKSAAD